MEGRTPVPAETSTSRESLLRAKGKRESLSPAPRNVFPLKKIGFEVDLKEARKGHRV